MSEYDKSSQLGRQEAISRYENASTPSEMNASKKVKDFDNDYVSWSHYVNGFNDQRDIEIEKIKSRIKQERLAALAAKKEKRANAKAEQKRLAAAKAEQDRLDAEILAGYEKRSKAQAEKERKEREKSDFESSLQKDRQKTRRKFLASLLGAGAIAGGIKIANLDDSNVNEPNSVSNNDTDDIKKSNDTGDIKKSNDGEIKTVKYRNGEFTGKVNSKGMPIEGTYKYSFSGSEFTGTFKSYSDNPLGGSPGAPLNGIMKNPDGTVYKYVNGRLELVNMKDQKSSGTKSSEPPTPKKVSQLELDRQKNMDIVRKMPIDKNQPEAQFVKGPDQKNKNKELLNKVNSVDSTTLSKTEKSWLQDFKERLTRVMRGEDPDGKRPEPTNDKAANLRKINKHYPDSQVPYAVDKRSNFEKERDKNMAIVRRMPVDKNQPEAEFAQDPVERERLRAEQERQRVEQERLRQAQLDRELRDRLEQNRIRNSNVRQSNNQMPTQPKIFTEPMPTNPWHYRDSTKAAAWQNLTKADQEWIGNGDPTDPYVLRRAPNKGRPK